MPKDTELTQALRRVVREALSTGEEITVNGARQRVEEELDLDEDFFKSDAKWKQKSKEIILAAFESAGDEPEEVKPKAVEKKAEGKAKAQAKKRKSEEPAPQPVKKRRRKNAVVEESDDEEEEENSEEGYSDRERRDTSKSDDDDDDDKDQDESDEEVTRPKSKSKTQSPAPAQHRVDANDSESDMSILIDDPPPKKRQSKKSSTPSDPPSKSKSKSTTTTSSSSSPDDEEIKRLQSWLVKCGIRKVWSRELASFSSSKDKIRHLKKLLSDAGMTGRFSAEKARSIKEARELQAEIQSAQEFNEVFGATKDGDSEGEGSGGGGETRGRRARPRGFVDFGDSGDDGSD